MARFDFLFAAALCALFLHPGALDAQKKYTMADLSALAKQEAWEELVEHLEDIPPAARDGQWQALAERGATQYLTAASADREPLRALVLADALTKRFAFLKKSKGFLAARADAGLKGIEACYDQSYSGGECTDKLLSFLQAVPDRELAMKAGKIVVRKQFPYFAVPFFKLGVAGGGGGAPCEDADLTRAVIAALNLPSDDKLVPEALAIAGDLCWDKMRETLAAELSGSEKGSYLAQNTCSLLKNKGAMAKVRPNPCGPTN